VGTPCKPIKLRYTDDELREHYRLKNKSKAEAEKMISIRRSVLVDIDSKIVFDDKKDNK